MEAVQIFLGVLANYILGVDLSRVDPRKLAGGEWEECVYVYVGGLLVHVAKKEGLMGGDEAIVDIDPEVSVSDVLEEVRVCRYSAAKYNKVSIRGWVSC